MNNLAPIALFVYNRLDHLKQTISSLQKNLLAEKSKLYIFSDAPKTNKDAERVNAVRNYVSKIQGFEEVIVVKRDKNFSLAESIIDGVSGLIKRFGKIIVLEDDLLLSKDFLQYMNDALNIYENEKQIFSIAGYSAPIKIPDDYEEDVFLFKRINSWGWASWKDRWESVDWSMSYFNDFICDKKQRKRFDEGGQDLSIMLLKQYTGKINSWAIRFNYACFIQQKQNVYPLGSKVANLGTDGSGTHVGKTSKYDNLLNEESVKFPAKLTVNKTIEKNYINFFKPSIFRQFINFFKIRMYLFLIKTCKFKNLIIFALYLIH